MHTLLKFPKDLARVVSERWPHVVSGDRYVVPPLPALKTLTNILESIYLGSASPEEGRFPQFNVLVVQKGANFTSLGVDSFLFDRPRPVSVSELRRLAPASDLKKSAICIEFDGMGAQVVGLADLGTSWHRARLGLGYHLRVPNALLVQVDRPGRLKIYQGQFLVASLAEGEFSGDRGIEYPLFLHRAVNAGLKILAAQFTMPQWEHPRDFENFWFIAHWNVFAAIANSVSLSAHGGTLIITDPNAAEVMECLRVKYSGRSDTLQKAFVRFINARNKTSDFYEKAEQKKAQPSKGVFEAELELTAAMEQLVEAVRFVANLASCDGAIVLSPDLQLLGFGAEIRAESGDGISVQEVISEMSSKYMPCDIEQFGMRHRSSIKLASRHEGVIVLAVSQDGPISAVWRKDKSVLVKRGVSLSNLNMPWAGGI